jgi:hypothetical protein
VGDRVNNVVRQVCGRPLAGAAGEQYRPESNRKQRNFHRLPFGRSMAPIAGFLAKQMRLNTAIAREPGADLSPRPRLFSRVRLMRCEHGTEAPRFSFELFPKSQDVLMLGDFRAQFETGRRDRVFRGPAAHFFCDLTCSADPPTGDGEPPPLGNYRLIVPPWVEWEHEYAAPYQKFRH